MDSEKQGISSSDSWGEEQTDLYDQLKDEDTDYSSAKRSYGCIFCKRGFTNAQALGGHMNIHRKDRAKAKQINGFSSPSSSSPPSSSSLSPYSLPAVPLERDKFYPSVFEAQMKKNQPSRCSSTNPNGYYPEISDWFGPRSTKSMSRSQELWGSDLSLQIGENEELRGRGVWNNDGVDLELRLGHDP